MAVNVEKLLKKKASLLRSFWAIEGPKKDTRSPHLIHLLTETTLLISLIINIHDGDTLKIKKSEVKIVTDAAKHTGSTIPQRHTCNSCCNG
jgi:hypothetical protein